MTETKKEKSNRTRAETTRTALIGAARHLFAEKGYAGSGTPEIVASADITRGALHHHFGDKLGLFRAVVLREAEIVAEQIAGAPAAPESPLESMLQGAESYFDAMSESGRARLLLLEGPAVLGVSEMEKIDRLTGQRELRHGLELAIQSVQSNTGVENDVVPLDALTSILSAAFDKAALSIVLGGSPEEYKEAIRILVSGIPGMSPNE